MQRAHLWQLAAMIRAKEMPPADEFIGKTAIDETPEEQQDRLLQKAAGWHAYLKKG